MTRVVLKEWELSFLKGVIYIPVLVSGLCIESDGPLRRMLVSIFNSDSNL